MRIKNAKFLKSASSWQEFPLLSHPEIALLGRSNVGKSSLLNHLFQKKGLAKTSSTPGKTRLLNFFSLNDEWTFVDLPGYGFAKTSLEEKEKWQGLIDVYLNKRENLKLLLFLLDIRHPPNEFDLQMLEWLFSANLHAIVVLTKCDKLSAAERNRMTLEIQYRIKGLPYVHYSINQNEGRLVLLSMISKILKTSSL